MCRNFCIWDIEYIGCIILSKGTYCIRTQISGGDENLEVLWFCKSKIWILMILINAKIRWLRYDNASYKMFNSIQTIDITSKFAMKSGLISPEVYYDNKETDLELSNRIQDLLFLTLACWRTGIFEAFS